MLFVNAHKQLVHMVACAPKISLIIRGQDALVSRDEGRYSLSTLVGAEPMEHGPSGTATLSSIRMK